MGGIECGGQATCKQSRHRTGKGWSGWRSITQGRDKGGERSHPDQRHTGQTDQVVGTDQFGEPDVWRQKGKFDNDAYEEQRGDSCKVQRRVAPGLAWT